MAFGLGFWNAYPGTDLHEIDLHYVLMQILQLRKDMQEVIDSQSITFADPITWNITSQYPAYTVVLDDAGNGYLSRQAVPAGIPLSNTSYWTQIFSFGDITDTIRANIAVNAEESPTTPVYLQKGQLVWWNDNLYEVQYDIAAGTAFIDDVNIKAITVDQKIRDIYNATIPYPIYYPSQELAVFGGSIGTGEEIEVSGDIHYYNEDTQTMSIVHND